MPVRPVMRHLTEGEALLQELAAGRTPRHWLRPQGPKGKDKAVPGLGGRGTPTESAAACSGPAACAHHCCEQRSASGATARRCTDPFCFGGA